jgi:uncharacterized protein DUF6406
MTLDEIALGPNMQRNTHIGGFGVVHVVEGRDGDLPEVLLAVEAGGEEHDFNLHPGDTFSVGDQTWKLERVENPGGRDWVVVLTRAD